MPETPNNPTGSGNSGFQQESRVSQMSNRTKTSRDGVVFSKNGSFNPTNLAVETSLQEIFEEFHTMVTGQLKQMNLEDNDQQPPT